MKLLYLRSAVVMAFLTITATGFAQTGGITSGAVYSLRSKSNGKLLDVSNASVDNGAMVDTWTDTRSDAERWIVKLISKNTYTLTNAGSGKLLHAAAVPADSVKVDQSDDTNSDDVKWVIKKAGSGAYFLQPAANPAFALNLNAAGTADGTKVNLAASSNAAVQKWVFQKETAQEAAPTLATAKKVFEDWYNGYKIEEHKGFWDQAEMMETVLDAYEVTRDPIYKARFDVLYKNFISNHKEDWMYNKYNDDITWAVLFCVRGYLLTGNKTYLDKAKDQYDKMYKRAFTNSYGGGLIWFETKTSKNACIEGPAAVAACYLAEATGDNTYYDKAIALYSWSKIYLFNPATGKVKDNVDLNKRTGLPRTSNISFTYNQGTFLGAATMLYNYTREATYLAEAEKLATFTRDTIYRGRVMNNEDSGGDLPGFKGIFARYARKYTAGTGKTDLVDWLYLNARVAYNNRNTYGIIQTKWATRTSEDKPVLKKGFGPSTAVSLLMNTYPLKK
ncbi:glycoside hydrolase family 76 protein [Mucilaginibacter sp. UR6-11]|uniref:glycoside hydrolase family 76 protein n=1 Tax=Mucilaginibacter sp. UR6-11 TaxID=1435644 RepID=UPI001E5C4BF6|nr:glycoside hydrolase family 76 protein [Mucilaginibacter sp. UR6-11]MCC8424772.1 RICIN domain-containing protein [Mucilaginibacter sp. UR6-11]